MNDAGRIGFVMKGDYDSTATYDYLDVVYFGNSSYVAKKLTIGNEPADDNEYWLALAKIPSNIVTGIKGLAENDFQSGNVTLTPKAIGALPENGTAAAADRLNSPNTIDGVAFDGSRAITHYATCTAAASETAKTVSLPDFSLIKGAGITIYFSNKNTAANPSLNVNDTGARTVHYNGSALTSENAGVLEGCCAFVFNGASWNLIGNYTMVKGDSELSYRRNLVNLTAGDVGALPKNGNAVSANKLITARTICTDLASSNTASFDGSANVTPGVTGVLPIANGGTGNTDGSVLSATKATQDSNGNNIIDTYAKKSIYGDSCISSGRYLENSGFISDVGYKSIAFGDYVIASKPFSCAVGEHITVTGECAHAEGRETYASGESSHAEGGDTDATGDYSHAEGYGTKASGLASHAEGDTTISNNYSSHASGKFNKEMANGGNYDNQIGDAFVVGNGTSESNRSNALRVTYSGDIYGTKAFNSSGADYAEFIKPWADGNTENDDRVGYFVTIKNSLLYKAEEGDYIYGITSGNPSIVGNADEDYYWRYERDEFNRIVMEDIPETVQQTDEYGNPVFDEKNHTPIMVETGNILKNARMKLSADYDPAMQESYIERKDRKEWDYVGILGVLPVRDDGTCLPDHFCKCGKNGIATLADEKDTNSYMVIERISEHVVSVLLK